jgi:hypothetical protein
MIIIIDERHHNVLSIRSKRHWLPMWTNMDDARTVMDELALGNDWQPLELTMTPDQIYRTFAPQLRQRYVGYIIDPGLDTQQKVKARNIQDLTTQ